MRLGSIMTGLVTLLAVQWCAAEEGISARHHAWGRFQPGAWKLVRVVTESLDENSRVIASNVTETKTSLLRVDAADVTLEVEVGVEVAGRQFDGLPQRVKQGFHGEMADGNAKFFPATAAEVTVENRKIPCRSQQYEITNSAGRTAVTLFFSDTLPPYILRRESKTTDTAGTGVLNETVSEVIALDMPQRVLLEIKNAACVKTVQKTPKGTVTSLAMTSPDVPGGVVQQTTKETDGNGRLLRRSTLELLNYGLRPETERTGLFGRKRPVRRKIYADGTRPN